MVRLDLDLDGILKVTAIERATGLARQVTIDNATERFRKTQRTDAVDRIEAAFQTIEGRIPLVPPTDDPSDSDEAADLPPDLREPTRAARELVAKANRLLPEANPEDASELKAMLTDLDAAIARRSIEEILRVSAEVEDLVFYLEDV